MLALTTPLTESRDWLTSCDDSALTGGTYDDEMTRSGVQWFSVKSGLDNFDRRVNVPWRSYRNTACCLGLTILLTDKQRGIDYILQMKHTVMAFHTGPFVEGRRPDEYTGIYASFVYE